MVRIHGSTCEDTPNFGFLTVVEDTNKAMFGGYLILNHLGRPLEFHCTAPIIPNRAQEILYGPTLRPFLFGEQIGGTLIERAKTVPDLLCVDRSEGLSVRDFSPAPVALVLDEENGNPADFVRSSNCPIHRIGINRLTFPGEDSNAAVQRLARLSAIIEQLDLVEPFTRIREAIDEARRGGAAA